MPTVKALDLEERLDEAAAAAVCVLVGDDESARSRCLGLIERAAAPTELPGSTVRRFEDDPEPGDVFDELRTVPFMGLEGRRVVVVEQGDAFLVSNWRHLADYVRRPSRTSTLLLCLSGLDAKGPPGARAQDQKEQGESARLWRRFVKDLNAAGLVVDCRAPDWRDAKRWVRARAEQIGNKLTPRAVDSLVEAVGPDLTALQNELEKLSAYVGDETTITERDVSDIVSEARARSVFDLGDAVARGELPVALPLCRNLLLRGESREGVISSLAYQTRRLWQMKRLHAAGASEKDIARQIGAPAFAVRRALKALPSVSEQRLARQVAVLAEADAQSKTTSLRSQEEAVWLESLLARLCGG